MFITSELKISNTICIPDKAMINILPTPMLRGVALVFHQISICRKTACQIKLLRSKSLSQYALNLAGLPKKFPPINNPSCLQMAFLDKSVEAAVRSRAEYWHNYTPSSDKMRNFQSGCCSCSTAVHRKWRLLNTNAELGMIFKNSQR